MPGRFMSRAVVPVMAGVLTLATGLASANAASSPGWRISKVLPVSSDLDSVAATAAGDAWAAGFSCGNPCGDSSLLVDRWNGTAWRRISAPSDVPASIGSAVVAASSASNAWVFAGISGSAGHTDVLHWTGHAWGSTTQFPDLSAITTAVAPSPTDAWAFGQITFPFSPYAAHYDGTSWVQVPFPINPARASASSASDVWVIGETVVTSGPGQVTIEHWDGQSWQEVALPPVTLPAGDSLQPADILAITPDNVWADAFVMAGQGEMVRVAPGTVLLHWNGTVWSQVTVPYPTYQPNSLAQDGHGGLWLSVDGDASENYNPYLVHDVNGHWHRIAVPAVAGDTTQLGRLSWIPGTHSVWAAGNAIQTTSGTSQGIILKNGN
jgi:hypothetical protein